MGSGKKTVDLQSAIITNIQGFSIHDGPGIRTVVFFKGCPLSCQWCANPECLSGTPQMGFIETLCADCGKCLEVCTNNAIRRARRRASHRLFPLHACGNCRDQCYYGALVRYGESMTVAEVWDAVRRDKMFYDNSGGGVTVSGGEPLLWPAFVRELFELSRRERIDTCIETCGLVDPEALLEVMPVTDHFLFDLKHMDSDSPRKVHRTIEQSNSEKCRTAPGAWGGCGVPPAAYPGGQRFHRKYRGDRAISDRPRQECRQASAHALSSNGSEQVQGAQYAVYYGRTWRCG